jgi:hypothetical protein
VGTPSWRIATADWRPSRQASRAAGAPAPSRRPWAGRQSRAPDPGRSVRPPPPPLPPRLHSSSARGAAVAAARVRSPHDPLPHSAPSARAPMGGRVRRKKPSAASSQRRRKRTRDPAVTEHRDQAAVRP